MRSMRRPVFQHMHAATEGHDPEQVWEALLASLNPTHMVEHARQERLRGLMAAILDQNVRPDSPALHMLQVIGDRWAPLILFILSTGTYRHSELQRVVNVLSEMTDATPISQRMLTLKLRMLERDGFLTRKIWPTVPPRADYALTELGDSLALLLAQVMNWCREHGARIVTAQQDHDRATGLPAG